VVAVELSQLLAVQAVQVAVELVACLPQELPQQ
jgi:hypothetical protein